MSEKSKKKSTQESAEDNPRARDRQSVQARYDEFIEYVAADLDDSKRRLLFTKLAWHEYVDGAWNLWTRAEETAFNCTLHRIATLREFPFSTSRTSIWTTLEAYFGSERPVEFDAQPMLVCNNGTYFLDDDKLCKWSPDHYATRRVDVDVDPRAKCPKWLEVLDRAFEDYPPAARKDVIGFLQEWMGIAIVGGAAIKDTRALCKALFLYGLDGTGKSSITDVLVELLGGPSRIATMSIGELNGRFGKQGLIGKSAWVSSDASSAKTVADANTLKLLITGEAISVDRKNAEPVSIRFHGPVCFTVNDLPQINESTNALYGRSAVVEMNRQFSKEEAKTTLGKYGSVIAYLRGHKQMPGILNWCLEGYDRAIERGFLDPPVSVQDATNQFRRGNDCVYDFVLDCCEFSTSSACATRAVAIACSEFSQHEYGVHISTKTAMSRLSRVIPQTVKGVSYGKLKASGTNIRAYRGLRLNQRGVDMFASARTKSLPEYKTLEKHVNYQISQVT